MIDPARFPDPFPPPFASAWGDDRFGLWVAIAIDGGAEVVTQILRWIEPGSFLMGSPDDEPERFDNEGPQHLVTLSHGYWLADTTCTQALWLAVMGHNPSRFKNASNNPVEQVNWLNVQAFLEKLQILLPACEVDLPSEAEWEYACRAGTSTPFSFGANITPVQVNYNGHEPYAGGEKGEFQGGTVQVKSLSANPWGLYEMHGNVWEWCKDGRHKYGVDALIEPLGPTGLGLSRVIRGGSWLNIARWARSALRLAYQPDSADGDLGFRFCLRSIRPGQAAGGLSGSPGGVRGAIPEG